MPTTAGYYTKPLKENTEKVKRSISLEAFLNGYAQKQDGYKYEWNNGIIEKSPRTMNRDQSIIQTKLNHLFFKTQTEGGLITELDMFLPKFNRTRRADMGYLTKEQMVLSKKGDLSPCPFVVEVISNNDKINETDRKLDEYFAEGVQVVWRIFPLLNKVEVFTSASNVKICRNNDICSAAPVLLDFEISVNQLLKD